MAINSLKFTLFNQEDPGNVNEDDLNILNPTTQIIATVTIKIENCGIPANVRFSVVNEDRVLLLTENKQWDGTPPDYISSFTAITYGPNDFLTLCPLDNFNIMFPAVAPAGAEAVITLQGSGFGTSPGIVYFRTEVLDSEKFMYAQDLVSDIVFWSESEIQVKVPSESATYIEDSFLKRGTASTGKVIVETSDGTRIESSSNLYVDYSVKNNVFGGKKYRINLINQNGIGGYTLNFSQELENLIPNSFSVTSAAINDWRCETHINWSLNPNLTPLNSESADNICLIYAGEGYEFTDDGWSAVTIFSADRFTVCNNSTGAIEFAYGLNEFDIAIRKPNVSPTNLTWFAEPSDTDIPLDEMDYYSVISHELGHGHLLNHTLNNDQVMFLTLSPSENKRVLTNGDIAGGIYNVNASIDENFMGPCEDELVNMVEYDDYCFIEGQTCPDELNIILESITDECQGFANGSIEVSIGLNNCEAYNIAWSSGDIGLVADDLKAGRYCVTAIAKDCENCRSVACFYVGSAPAGCDNDIPCKEILANEVRIDTDGIFFNTSTNTCEGGIVNFDASGSSVFPVMVSVVSQSNDGCISNSFPIELTEFNSLGSFAVDCFNPNSQNCAGEYCFNVERAGCPITTFCRTIQYCEGKSRNDKGLACFTKGDGGQTGNSPGKESIITTPPSTGSDLFEIGLEKTAPLQDNITLTLAKIYPNPFTKNINIELESIDHQSVQVELTDIYGRTVISEIQQLTKGVNFIRLQPSSNLASGIYALTITDQHQKKYTRLITRMNN